MPTGGKTSCYIAPTKVVHQKLRERILHSQAQLQEGVQAEYPWVPCIDQQKGMFCRSRQKNGSAPATARGVWKRHRDSVIHVHVSAQMAQQGESETVLQLHCSAAAKGSEERRARNTAVLLKFYVQFFSWPKIGCLLQPPTCIVN